MKKIFASNSYKYFNCGFKPIPLYGKRPIIKEWTSIDITEEVLDKWNDSFPDANIGILTGAASGVVCIDIDKEESIQLCPNSPLVKKGSKGETRFFKYNGETAQKFHAQGIEILSDGNQTVMPPSIHPGTNSPYVWLSEVYEDLPEIPKEFLASLSKTPINVNGITEVSYELGPLEKDRCRSNSYNKFSQMLVAKIHDGKEYNQIMSELLEYDEKENTIVSFFKCPSRPGRWHLRSREENCKKFMDEAYKKHKIEPVTEPVTKLRIEFNEPVEEKVMGYKSEKLPMFRGVMQDMFNYIYSQSDVKRTRFCVPSVLSIMSTILGNKLHCNRIYTNMYLVITAPSGAGKNIPMRMPYNLFNMAGYPELIGGSPESDSGILKGLEEQNTRLDLFDEASRLFVMMGDKKNSYASKMADQYALIYTSPGAHYPGKKLGNTIMGACYSPCVSLLCALTISDFKKNFTIDLVSKGVGGRFLFFPDDQYKEIELVEERPWDSSIINFVRYCRSMKTPNGKSQSMYMSKEDGAYFLEVTNHYRNLGHKNGVELLEPIYNRLGENIMKLAIMDSVSNGREKMTKDSLDWGVSWINSYVPTITAISADIMNQTETHSNIDVINKIIISKKSAGIKRSDLLSHSLVRRFCSSSKELQTYIETMCDMNLIVKQNSLTKGRSAEMYFSTKYASL